MVKIRQPTPGTFCWNRHTSPSGRNSVFRRITIVCNNDARCPNDGEPALLEGGAMNIVGLESLVYGVDDVDAAIRFHQD